ncbi:uncharacterized protein LOC126819365 [Patella vulgata]|uniref:uncharacterized protein LOC126819365 n=1 Tax=Patella vulgata TaxID=6465 RepID=UPI00217FDC2E|nr:uncharacterized protein LOC126819365 [Patella vulgata]
MLKHQKVDDLEKSRDDQDVKWPDEYMKISETNFDNSFEQQQRTDDETRSNSSSGSTCTATSVVDANMETLNGCLCSDPKKLSEIHDIFVYSPTTTPVSSKIITSLSEHNFLCCDSGSFIPGETRLDNFGNCLDSSKQLILVISPDFLECQLSLFYIQMAVIYGVDSKQKRYRILVVLDGVKKSSIPKTTKGLTCISAKDKDWLSRLLKFVKDEDHGDASQLHVTTTDTAMSDPLPLRDIPASVKKNNRMLLKKVKSQSSMTEEQERILLKPIECDNVDFESNMEYFYRLKAAQKRVYEIIETFNSQKVRVDSGDIVEIIHSTKCKKRVIIQNAKGKKMKIRTSLISPVLFEMPSIVTSKMTCPITQSQNTNFMEELKHLGCRMVRAKDTILAHHDHQLKISPGEILRNLLGKNENDKWIRVRNFRGQTGIVDGSTCEPVVI